MGKNDQVLSKFKLEEAAVDGEFLNGFAATRRNRVMIAPLLSYFLLLRTKKVIQSM